MRLLFFQSRDSSSSLSSLSANPNSPLLTGLFDALPFDDLTADEFDSLDLEGAEYEFLLTLSTPFTPLP